MDRVPLPLNRTAGRVLRLPKLGLEVCVDVVLEREPPDRRSARRLGTPPLPLEERVVLGRGRGVIFQELQWVGHEEVRILDVNACELPHKVCAHRRNGIQGHQAEEVNELERDIDLEFIGIVVDALHAIQDRALNRRQENADQFVDLFVLRGHVLDVLGHLDGFDKPLRPSSHGDGGQLQPPSDDVLAALQVLHLAQKLGFDQTQHRRQVGRVVVDPSGPLLGMILRHCCPFVLHPQPLGVLLHQHLNAPGERGHVRQDVV
mmetsp:Transcript_16831/g.46390  ORF Transcript_16831/g.46390 Transcript_16831/m.46390 type:complete len:261 (+) Transcript_16831:377-1159(+)